MKIFLSWSGETSHRVATALHYWLPYMIQSLEPFLSSEDISKGTRWGDALAVELDGTQYGIICLTPYNISKPWMNFEAGALSKLVGRSYVMPFLFQIDRSGVKGPLAQFQATVFSEADVFNMVSSINRMLGPQKQLNYELLRQTFNAWWEKLKEELDSIQDTQEGETETEYPWLFTPQDLKRTEARALYKSIWIITPNPSERAVDLKTINMVIENLSRGIHYTYIVPDSEEMTPTNKKLEEMAKEMAKAHPGMLVVKKVNERCFSCEAITDYIIMNPDSDENNKLRAFLKLPVASGEYWIEVGAGNAAIDLMERFKAWAQ
jgi:hypothetical protein